MGVLENSLSSHGSYNICYNKDKGYIVHHTHKKFITDYMTKEDLFKWGVENIPYGKIESMDE